ncbi:hypothetical protein BJ165DRAFT_1406124 [Panaeolus papilionaceus]|nr:hypothetical protein BJ165DRAFT_1406124 [Panaeolus papilionaceus]
MPKHPRTKMREAASTREAAKRNDTTPTLNVTPTVPNQSDGEYIPSDEDTGMDVVDNAGSSTILMTATLLSIAQLFKAANQTKDSTSGPHPSVPPAIGADTIDINSDTESMEVQHKSINFAPSNAYLMGDMENNNDQLVTVDSDPQNLWSDPNSNGEGDTAHMSGYSNEGTESDSSDVLDGDGSNDITQEAQEPDDEPTSTTNHSNPQGHSVVTVDELSEDQTSTYENFYLQVQRVIITERKRLKKIKAIASQAMAVENILLLDAVQEYNDTRYEHAKKINQLRKQLPHSNRKTRPILTRQIKSIRPSMDTSSFVAHRRMSRFATTGTHLAKKLRSTANHLFRTGSLPESKKGKGAYHKSHLNRQDVQSKLQKWVKGVFDPKDGGFVGNLRPIKLRRYVNDFLFKELGIPDMSDIDAKIR